MRSLGLAFLLGICGALAAAPPALSATEEPITADVFTKHCEAAKKLFDAKKLEALEFAALTDKGKAEDQADAAETALETAVSAMFSAVLGHERQVGSEIAALRDQMEAARKERDRFYAIMLKEKTGPKYQEAHRQRAAKNEEIASLDNDRQAAIALRERLVEGIGEIEFNNDPVAKAAAIKTLVNDLGLQAALSFASLSADWTSATVSKELADHTLQAAEAALECISKKADAYADARDAEAQFLYDRAFALGEDMKAKARAMQKAEQAVRDLWAVPDPFEGDNSEKILTATDTYIERMNEVLAVGREFRAEVDRLASKGVVIESWMTQLMDLHTHTEAAAAKMANR